MLVDYSDSSLSLALTLIPTILLSLQLILHDNGSLYLC